MVSNGSDLWPPGGSDPLIDALAHDWHIDESAVDMKGLLSDPRLGRIAIVSSFGADSVVLLHYLSMLGVDWPVLFLNTGKHFPETLTYVEEISAQLHLNVQMIRPDPQLLEEDDPDGTLWQRSPNYCCQIRKLFPLQDALAEYDTWISGRKRFQAATRQGLPLLERDGNHIKINPLALWAAEDIAQYMEAHGLHRHPLLVRGYLSIGCAPCTRPVNEGEDSRSGRWAHVPEKIECGIHLGPDGKFRREP